MGRADAHRGEGGAFGQRVGSDQKGKAKRDGGGDDEDRLGSTGEGEDGAGMVFFRESIALETRVVFRVYAISGGSGGWFWCLRRKSELAGVGGIVGLIRLCFGRGDGQAREGQGW